MAAGVSRKAAPRSTGQTNPGGPSKAASRLHWLYVIPLLLFTVLVFVETLALGLVGITRASNSSRPCVESANGADCTSMQHADTQHEDEFVVWLAGATGCCFLFAAIATFSAWVLDETLHRVRKTSKVAVSNEQYPNLYPSLDPIKKSQNSIDTMDGYYLMEKFPPKLRKMNIGAVVALFFCFLCFISAVVCMMWAVAIGVNHSHRRDKTVTPFVIVDLLAAIISPSLFFISGIIAANIVDFLTFGQADARAALPYFLHFLRFERGEKYDYWVIEDSFYFELKKWPDREEHGFCYSCYPNFSTWVLVGIVALSLILAISYFADITIAMQISVNSCNDDRIDRTFSCFNSSSLAFVDCLHNTNVELIHCFKFHRFGVDTNIVTAIATTFTFYLVTSALFGRVFLGLKVFLHVSHRKIWGYLVVAVGVMLFVLSCAIILAWLTGYISAAQPELARLNVISLWQFLMVSLFVVLAGATDGERNMGRKGENGTKE